MQRVYSNSNIRIVKASSICHAFGGSKEEHNTKRGLDALEYFSFFFKKGKMDSSLFVYFTWYNVAVDLEEKFSSWNMAQT